MNLNAEQAVRPIGMHFQFSMHKYPACSQAYFKRWCSALAALEASVCIAMCSGKSLEHSKYSWKVCRAAASEKGCNCVFTSPVTGSRDPPTLHNIQSCTVRQAIIELDPLNTISATSVTWPRASARRFTSTHQVISVHVSQNKDESSAKDEEEGVS